MDGVVGGSVQLREGRGGGAVVYIVDSSRAGGGR